MSSTEKRAESVDPAKLTPPDNPRSPYGIAGRAAAEAVLEHGRDGSRLRPANDAFLLSRIARAVVDALNAEYVIRPRGDRDA